ncbi:hypothetical protein BY996DRAFT_7241680 [Phakopsora pachyrhizi]|nr:hypothetical protein BY996DRAFT_7241680 [Phakopsora pachyrhizi]
METSDSYPTSPIKRSTQHQPHHLYNHKQYNHSHGGHRTHPKSSRSNNLQSPTIQLNRPPIDPSSSTTSHDHQRSSSNSPPPPSGQTSKLTNQNDQSGSHQPSTSQPDRQIICNGCKSLLEDNASSGDSVVVSFGSSLWHVDCFRCAKCRNLVEHDTNLLLLSDGSPVCENCSYICSVCKLPISNEAIVTGEESYHAECFRCRSCSNRIEELIFAKTSQGIYCMTCHNERVTRSRRHAETKRNKSSNQPSSKRDRDRSNLNNPNATITNNNNNNNNNNNSITATTSNNSISSSSNNNSLRSKSKTIGTASVSSPTNSSHSHLPQAPSYSAPDGNTTISHSANALQSTYPTLGTSTLSNSSSSGPPYKRDFQPNSNQPPKSASNVILPSLSSNSPRTPIAQLKTTSSFGSLASSNPMKPRLTHSSIGSNQTTPRPSEQPSVTPQLQASKSASSLVTIRNRGGSTSSDRGGAPSSSTHFLFQRANPPLPPLSNNLTFISDSPTISSNQQLSDLSVLSSIETAAKPFRRPSTSDGALSPGTVSQHELALFPRSPDSSPQLRVSPKLGSSVSGLSIKKDQGSRGGVYGLPMIEHGDQNGIGGGTSNNMFKNSLSLATQQELIQSQSSFSRADEDKAMRTVKRRASDIQPQRSVLETPPAAVDSLMPRPLRSGSSGGERPLSYYDPEVLFMLDKTSPIGIGNEGFGLERKPRSDNLTDNQLLGSSSALATESQKNQPEGSPKLNHDQSLKSDLAADLAQVEKLLSELQITKEQMKDICSDLSVVKKTEGIRTENDREASVREDLESKMRLLKSRLIEQASRLQDIESFRCLKNEADNSRHSVSGLQKHISQLVVERQLRVAEFEMLKNIGAHDSQDEQLGARFMDDSEEQLCKRLEKIRNEYQAEIDQLVEQKEQLQIEVSHLFKVRESHVKELESLNRRQDLLAELNAAAMRRLEETRTTLGKNGPRNLTSSGTAKSTFQSPSATQAYGFDALDEPTGHVTPEVNIATTRKFKWGKSHAHKASTAAVINRSAGGGPSGAPHGGHTRDTGSISGADFINGNGPNNGSNPPNHRSSNSIQQQGGMGILRPHNFQPVSALRPVRCDYCGEKLWGLAEVRCSVCGSYSHSKCAPNFFGCQASSPTLEQHNGSTPEDDYLNSNNGSRNNLSGENLNGGVMVFGNELESLCRFEKVNVPRVVVKCIEAVEKHGLQFEGIYRKTGGMSSVKMIQGCFEKGAAIDLNDLDRFNDISAITSTLKNYFRQLPNPLFTFELHEAFVAVAGMAQENIRLEALERVIYQLPLIHFETLKVLMKHLNKIESNSDTNKMTSQNLGVVFGPTLLRSSNPKRQFSDMPFTAKVVELSVVNALNLFKKPFGGLVNSSSSSSSFSSNNNNNFNTNGGLGISSLGNIGDYNGGGQSGYLNSVNITSPTIG